MLEIQIGDMIDGYLANAEALHARPTDREAGHRLRAHIIDLERLVTIRAGL